MNTREETYHMTEKEMVRLKVIERLLEGDMRVSQAADILMLSTRQVIRIKERVRRLGPGAVIHGNRDRRPINATDVNIKDLVRACQTSPALNHCVSSIEQPIGNHIWIFV